MVMQTLAQLEMHMKIRLASDGNLSSHVYAVSQSAAFRLSGTCANMFRSSVLQIAILGLELKNCFFTMACIARRKPGWSCGGGSKLDARQAVRR